MLFPKADIDKKVQNYDMFRIDASKSFFTGDIEDLTDVNIYPEFATDPGVVFNLITEDQECWVLDWAYKTEADYTVKIEMKTSTLTEEVTYIVTSVTSSEDNLLSDDSMIYALESELKRYVPEGRNSWKYLHRAARNEMLDYMYRNHIVNPDGTEILASQLKSESNLEEWAKYETMLLIFQDIKSSNSEAFNEKLVDYSEKRANARKRYVIEYDSNKDGNVDEEDGAVATTPTFFHR